MSRQYITLVTSLPYLPYFESADRLPITERAVTERLSMLEEDDANELRRAFNLLHWGRHAVTAQTEQIEKQYRAVMEKTTNEALREYVDWHIGGRTALAALRLKARGQTTVPEKPWGAGPRVRSIEANWDKQYVQLEAPYPWLKDAALLLSKQDAVGLERLLMTVDWRRLTILSEVSPFGFETVSAYVFKWGIVMRWLANDAQVADKRFKELIEEVIGEYKFVG